jgi:acetolactate synthase-1/2/3 large subunit
LSDLLTCADVIAETLSASGVRHVFGHPGGEVLDLMLALEKCNIDFLLVGHESAAAFMAGAVGRITGLPGVCLATLGPGACNLVLGVGSAFLDRDPLLAFSARATTNRCRISSKQHLQLNDLFAPISKWSVAMNGMRTAETLRSAISLAQGAPCGPVYLTLPSDIAAGLDKGAGVPLTPPGKPSADDRDFEVISRILNGARRPIGIVGISLNPRSARDSVRSFFAETGIPYVTSPQAKGLADESGDAFLGTVGSGAGDTPILDFLSQSDCFLGVGFDPVESSQGWHFEHPLYSLAHCATGFGQYKPTAECIGDVGVLLDRLRAGYHGTSSWTISEIQKLRQRIHSAICPSSEKGAAGLAPFHLIRTLRQALPEGTIVTSDVGAHKMLLSQAWHTPEPGRFLVSNGLSAMGYGVPTAIAAALLHPDHPVVAIIGDGGFGMMVQELETARRFGVKPLFVVLCDRSLAVIKIAQNDRGMPHYGVDFGPVDWVKVAEGFGARAAAPSNLANVQREIAYWLERRELTVLPVPVDESLYIGLTY